MPSSPTWRLEPLAGWHLPLLNDPAFLPLQPVLQRTALLGMPEQVLRLLGRTRPLGARVLVAFADHSQTVLGLIVSKPLNRSGSCWQIQHLRTTRPDLRHPLSSDLLQRAMERTNTNSWVAAAASDDRVRLRVLREQGFQPLRQDQSWQWQPEGQAPTASLGELQLQPLNNRNAALVWHLEQALCAAQLRQIFDRRVEDLLDQSQGRGLVLVDPSRKVAVAAVRWLGEHAGGGHDVELSVQPGWEHLYTTPLINLLYRLVAQLPDGGGLWLRSDPYDSGRLAWLHAIGAQLRSERVLMARSLWRRQAAAVQTSQRFETVLAQLRPRQRPVPTPALKR